MRFALAFLCTCLAAAALFAQAEKPAEKPPQPVPQPEIPADVIKVKLVGVSVIKPDENQPHVNRFWGWMGNGTSLSLTATSSNGAIVGIDYSACKLVTLKDDLGTNLAEPYEKGVLEKIRGDRGQRWLQGSGMHDRTVWRFGIGSPDVPAEGALAITLKAKVVFLYALKDKTSKQKDVELKAGTKLDFDGLKMEIVNQPEGWWAGNQAAAETKRFGLQWQQEGDIVREIRFYRADGTEMPAQNFGSSQGGDERKMTMTRYYNFTEKIEKATVSVTYYDDVKRLTVPIEITTGVGF